MVVALLAMQSVASADCCDCEECCECCCECQPGCGTPGYWVNHPEAWPVCSITIDSVTYTKEQCLYWISQPVKGDKTLTLFPAYVAAVLNVEIGNCDCCIDEILEEAREWLADYPPGSDVSGSSCAWKCGECLYLWLDYYNNGWLCAPSRDAVE
jgi:hypothetical protein